MSFPSEGDVYLSKLWRFFELYGWYCVVGLGALLFLLSKHREYKQYLSANNRFLASERKAELDAKREKARAEQQAKYEKLVETTGESKPFKPVTRKPKISERLNTTPTRSNTDFQPSARRWGADRRRRGGGGA